MRRKRLKEVGKENQGRRKTRQRSRAETRLNRSSHGGHSLAVRTEWKEGCRLVGDAGEQKL